MKDKIVKDLEKQGYRIVGKHSAIKVCLWCKRAICNEDVCYKNTFYGIQTHRCIQSSVSVLNCLHNCQFCWRCLDYTDSKTLTDYDEPEFILDGLIKQHKIYLQGFKGNDKVTEEVFEEAMDPKHVALSLAGDATMYPKLPELIELIHERGMTTFLVTNGLMPDMMEKLLEHQPTQLYITLAAPDKETYLKVCRPLVKDGWERLQRSLELLKNFNRSTLRLTLIKNLNMHNAKGYAEHISKTRPNFVELKAGMPVGYAQYRIAYEDMARHHEIKDFAEKIAENTDYKIVDEKENSRVVLLMKEEKDKKLNLQ